MILEKKTIIITGASSGLGRALAIQYSLKDTRIFLFGRSKSRLEAVADLCRAHHAEITTIICDVRDKQQVRNHIEEILKYHGVDLLITSAGVSAGTLNGSESAAQVYEIFDTNLNGSLNFILPVMDSMIKNKKGDIVIISSMAGLIGLSSAPSYSASKAAIKIFGDALRAYLRQFNVRVCVAIPGYIDTPMTQVNNFPMPFKISATTAARIIIRGVHDQRGLIIFPKITYFMLKLLNLLPYRFIDYINSKLPQKPSFNQLYD